jgi:beta-lactam-binding protein with PASTA domain
MRVALVLAILAGLSGCTVAVPPTTETSVVVMPDVVGLPVEEAIEAIEDAGLIPFSDHATGEVSLQEPVAGTRMAPETEVFLRTDAPAD